MQPYPLPKSIDDPITLLLWRADEFVPMALLLMTGMLVGQVLASLILGLITVRYYRKYRDNRPDGYVLHALYWAGCLNSRARTIPNPFIRRFLP